MESYITLKLVKEILEDNYFTNFNHILEFDDKNIKENIILLIPIFIEIENMPKSFLLWKSKIINKLIEDALSVYGYQYKSYKYHDNQYELRQKMGSEDEFISNFLSNLNEIINKSKQEVI